MKIQTEAVITEVCLRPVLWDRNHKFYRNKLHRDAAWKEILMELVPDYDKLSSGQRLEADKQIQQRWRTARDTYKKERSGKNQESDPTCKKKMKYSYFDILKFLDKDNVSITDDIDSGDTPTNSKEGMISLVPLEQQADFSMNQYPSSSAFEVSLVDRIRSNELELEIEDLAFFQSLQPSLKQFTRTQKLMFRTRVLNIVLEMENQISVKKEISDNE